MTDQSNLPAVEPAPPARRQPTKSAIVVKLLSRAKGATLAEIMEATSWQPHSTRAFLTGLRKQGKVLLREARTTGETNWRIGG
jgi:Protein of unknown function (DUF3489)